MYSAYLISFLLLATALQVMGDAPAAAPVAAQPSAATGSNGMVGDVMMQVSDAFKGLPLVGQFVEPGMSIPMQVLAMIKQLLTTFIGKTGMIATLPIVGTFAEPMRNVAESFLGKLEAAQSAPAQ
ncbi:hypothetical protein PRIPAC_81199 [Pristionchus pacificus]|uniref:Uncharacterized protein n=1 Tax=Pristionchus pacificus TaxID=54126 RepID=A0A2A6CPS6_PRIPA|nr:hypothetical protein PRIPAC_81199 [Pristionchus pacificus]|eukprot:PDM80120.1 hypothetical protein PRIPAC_32699 [Pristionchus pacificus]